MQQIRSLRLARALVQLNNVFLVRPVVIIGSPGIAGECGFIAELTAQLCSRFEDVISARTESVFSCNRSLEACASIIAHIQAAELSEEILAATDEDALTRDAFVLQKKI